MLKWAYPPLIIQAMAESELKIELGGDVGVAWQEIRV